MQEKSLPLYGAVIFFIVVIITVGFLTVQEPEQFTMRSHDESLLLTGYAREVNDLSITAVGDEGGQYDVTPTETVFEQPIVMQFAIPDDIDEPALYRYDELLHMWMEVPFVLDEDRLQAVVTSLGRFWVRERVSVDAPVFAEAQEELMSMAPTEAVGYEFFLAVALDDITVQLQDGYMIGWCDGHAQLVDTLSYSQLERTARVYVNDVEQEVTFLLVAKWLENKNGGCSEDNPLETSLRL